MFVLKNGGILKIFPQSLCASSPVTSLTTSAASSFFQPGDCYLFTRSRDYQFLCVFSSAAPSFSPVICVFRFLSSAVVFFICTCVCFFFSYLMLLHHPDSSATPGSCDAVAISMCLHAATQKVKIQNVLTKISKTIKNKGPNNVAILLIVFEQLNRLQSKLSHLKKCSTSHRNIN